MKNTYRDYIFFIRTASGGRFVEVRAISLEAARADMEQAFTSLDVIQVSCRG